MKRGQITIFLIIGLVLLFIGAIVYYAAVQYQGAGILGDPFKPIENYVQECLEQVSLDSINLLSLQGGYIYLEGNYLSTPYQDISFALPSDETMEQEMNRFIEEGIEQCTDFGQFSAQVTVDRAPKATTKILAETVSFTLSYPLTMIKGNDVKKVDSFQYIAPTRLGHVAGIMRHLLTLEDWLDLTESSQYDINLNVLTYNEAIIYHIEDEESLTNGKFHNFLVARP